MNKSDNPKYFCVYTDNIRQVSTLTNEESGALFKALFGYVNGLDCSEVAKYPRAELALNFMAAQIDRDYEKLRILSENGKKGGAPKGNSNAAKRSKQPKTSKNNKYNNKYKDNNENENNDNNNDDVFKRALGAQSYDINELNSFRPLVVDRDDDS